MRNRPRASGSATKLLIWLGNAFFSGELAGSGLRVLNAPYIPGTLYTRESILDLTGGEMPDAVLAADASVPPFLLGMEDLPCLTLFYSIDAHIHSWQPMYARGFDVCLVSLKEYLPVFAGIRADGSPDAGRGGGALSADPSRPLRAMPESGVARKREGAPDDAFHPHPPWTGSGVARKREGAPLSVPLRTKPGCVFHFPPYAPDGNRPPLPAPDRDLAMVFVGTLDARLAPRRCAFIGELKEKFPSLHIAHGPFVDLYARAKLIVNECSRGELNFRVFEAMGMGGCLLTPDIGPALSAMFTPGKELFTYPPYAVGRLVALAERLLADDASREKAAEAGLAAVDAGHRASHRARALAGILGELFSSGRAAELIAERLRDAPLIRRYFLRPLYLHHAESVGVDCLRDRYLETSGKR
jgi:hypothetical protein